LSGEAHQPSTNETNDLEKLFQKDYFEKFNTSQPADNISQNTSVHNK